MSTHITTKIVDELIALPLDKQNEVLAFARSLRIQSVGVKGSSLLKFAGDIPVTDLTQMQKAIEEDCERIDPDEW